MEDSASPRTSSGASVSRFYSGVSAEVKGCFIVEYSPFAAPRIAQTIRWSSTLSLEVKQWLFEFLTKELLHVAENKSDYFAVKTLYLGEIEIAVLVVIFAYEDVGAFTACIVLPFSKKSRLNSLFQSQRDHLQRIYYRIWTTEEEVDIIKEWSVELDTFLPIVDRWVTSHIPRRDVPAVNTYLVEKPPGPISLAAVVQSASSFHRCIIRGDDPETVKKWVHTLTHFMLDDRLMFASDVCSTSVDGIVPDLHLQGTTAEVTPEFIDKLYLFQYPCCVVDISKRADVAAHIVPPAATKLAKYLGERWEYLVGDVRPREPTNPFVPIRVKSNIVRSISQRVERSQVSSRLAESMLALFRRDLYLRALSNYVREVDLKDANLESPATLSLKIDDADSQILAVAIEHIYPLQSASEQRAANMVVQAFEF